jgi:hypothetical protein
MSCPVQANGSIELYFYGELPLPERAQIQAHLLECDECRRALEDLSVIRAALAVRPDVATPPGGDWSGFMARLEARVAAEASTADGVPPATVIAMPRRGWAARYLAVAAVLVLLAMSAVLVLRRERSAEPSATVATAGRPAVDDAVVRAVSRTTAPDPVLASVTSQHFERSKLVVLGLAMKDPRRDDWAYERELAASLLNDTRVYRVAAEARGMQSLVGVMRDLELVLLQTSMSEQPDAASLEQLQRLIRRRDLITRMDVMSADRF